MVISIKKHKLKKTMTFGRKGKIVYRVRGLGDGEVKDFGTKKQAQAFVKRRR